MARRRHGVAQPGPDDGPQRERLPANCPACQTHLEVDMPATVRATGITWHRWSGVHLRRGGVVSLVWACPDCGHVLNPW